MRKTRGVNHCYCCQNSIAIFQHVRVPETQNAISMRCECGNADAVVFTFGMLAAIYFNNKPLFSANEIYNVCSYGFLANELEPAQMPVTQREPQLSLAVSSLTTQTSLDGYSSSIRSTHEIDAVLSLPHSSPMAFAPHPNPLPVKNGEREPTELAAHCSINRQPCCSPVTAIRI